jgi:ribosomal protein L11 methylase PrmA
MTNDGERVGGSFRDPSGFLFTRQGVLYRQVNQVYREHYDLLMSSGLYSRLVDERMLISHAEVQVEVAEPTHAYKIIQPEVIKFISYPYEWCFSQLKDAALLTLEIQKRAMEAGMSLKDSSGFNIQFHNGRPVLIDTLSFEIYQEGKPWDAYRQFCQHFLAPLVLMAFVDIRLGSLLRNYLDGIPLNLASRLLPQRTHLNLGINLHIHVHAAAQKRYAQTTVNRAQVNRRMSRVAFLGLIDSLQSTISKLTWKPVGTEWGDYYSTKAGHYSPAAMAEKRKIVAQFIEQIHPHNVWDLGANTGEFSRLASDRGYPTLAFDLDPAAVEYNYLSAREKKEANLLPLLLDLTNPTPALGWQNYERASWLERGPADAVLALALIHHLAIANNVPLTKTAEFFHQLGRWLIIEFVPKTDPQVQHLLATRQDIFPDYTLEKFQEAFLHKYIIHSSAVLPDSQRYLFLMKGR